MFCFLCFLLFLGLVSGRWVGLGGFLGFVRCLVWGTLLWFGVRIEVQFFEFLNGIKLGREMRT